MHATVFEWNNWSTELDSTQHRLVMEIGKHFINYVIIDKDNNIKALKYQQTTTPSGKEWYDAIIDGLQAEKWIHQSFQQAVVIYSLAEQILIPETYFNIDHNRSMLDAIHGDLHKGVTLSEKVHGWDAYNVYRIPTELHQYLQQQFDKIQSWHNFTLTLQYCDKMDSHRNDKMVVTFYQHTLMLAVIKNSQLKLVQTMGYQTAEDAAFYLLQACQTYDLPPATSLIILDGMIEEDSTVYRELHKYFGQLVWNQLPVGIQLPEIVGAYPEQFFSPLLKMTLCVL